MRDLLKELIKARKKIYINNEFKDLLSELKNISADNAINWDEGAGEEWAFVYNQDLSIMLNRRIGIYFVRGALNDAYSSVLDQGNCVFVEGFDLNEWHIDLIDLQKSVPEIIWHTSDEAVDPNSFSLDDLYFATV